MIVEHCSTIEELSFVTLFLYFPTYSEINTLLTCPFNCYRNI